MLASTASELLVLLVVVELRLLGTTIVGLLVSEVLEAMVATTAFVLLALLVTNTPPKLLGRPADDNGDGGTDFPFPVPFALGLRPQPDFGVARGLTAGWTSRTSRTSRWAWP